MKPISQLLTILITYLSTNLVWLKFRNYQEKVRRKRSEAALWKSEARYRSLVNAMAQVVWTTNAEGQVVDDLPSWRLLTGQSREEIQGWGWLNAIHPEDQAETARRWTQAIATKGIFEIEHRVQLVDGSYGFFLARGVPVLDLESILEWVGTHTDITAHKQAQEALYQSQIKFQRLVANMPGMVYTYLPCADGPDQFTFINSTSRELLELDPEMVLQDASSFVKLIHPDDLVSFQESVATSAQNFLPWHWEGRIITLSGHLKWIQGSSRPERTPEGDVWDGLLIDITERKQAEAQLRHNALHDVLTGLANRVLFMDRLSHAIERTKRCKDYLFAVLFLDLDRFKVINDSLGHVIGDQLLIAIAHKLEACVRSVDTVARLGGDEFAILLEDIQGIEYATQVADRIQEELTLPFKLSGHDVFTTASIGIAPCTLSDQPEDLLRDADITMYCAKALGKAQYQVFDKTMHTRAMAQLQLETDLRRALERQEFRLHYQPIVDLDSGTITGFEALVRWQHPVRGLVCPAEFIPAAEETGLSVLIDHWVLREACCQTQQWQELFPNSPPLTISVNLSNLQFRQSQLSEHINQVVQEASLPAYSLKLEITENMIMTDDESATAKLLQLKALGIQLCIDDFGTGYSSLSRLQSFPIDVLKVDWSFVSRMSSNQGNLQIVETIVTLAQILDMDVVAEGVETAEQLAQLRELKCGYGQGYFFSRGLDSKAAEALLVAKPQW